MTFSIETYLKKYDTLNQELRAHWMMGREAARNVGVKINELVSSLHREHKDWNIKKIAYTIAGANDDLEGFSIKTIYGHLNEDNKALLDVTHQQNAQKNVLEESVFDGKQKDIEESSSDDDSETTTRILPPTAYEVKEGKTDNIINQLPKSVIKLAEKIELSPNKLRLVVNPKLKEHPELQKDLVTSIAPLPIDKAKIVVAQEIRYLETGALFKSGKSYHVNTYLRDKIESKPEVEKSPHQYYFELSKDMLKFLEHITGHEIVKGENEYTEKHIEYTEKHRIEIIKALDERTVRALKDDLKVVRSGINSMLDIIDKEVIGKKDSD